MTQTKNPMNQVWVMTNMLGTTGLLDSEQCPPVRQTNFPTTNITSYMHI